MGVNSQDLTGDGFAELILGSSDKSRYGTGGPNDVQVFYQSNKLNWKDKFRLWSCLDNESRKHPLCDAHYKAAFGLHPVWAWHDLAGDSQKDLLVGRPVGGWERPNPVPCCIVRGRAELNLSRHEVGSRKLETSRHAPLCALCCDRSK